MTDLDERVRALLETRARDVAVNPEMPETVGVRSRRRRALAGAGAGLGVMAAIILGAAAFRQVAFEQRIGDDPTVGPSPVTPSPVTPSPATPSPDERAPVAGYPDSFVAFGAGEIVLVDARSGETLRVLLDRQALGGPDEEGSTPDLELSPDGTTLFFVEPGSPERIMRVPVDGGRPMLVANGRKPTMSPDGRKLAYVACESEFAGCGNALHVLDLGTGETTVWDVGADEMWVGQMAWLPDSTRLGFSMFYAGDSNPTMHLLDTLNDEGVELMSVEKIGPEEVGAGWTIVGFHPPSDGFVVRSYCCSTYATDEVDESSVISVAATGEVGGTLLDRADWLDIEVEASGQHVLLLEPGGDVYRLDGRSSEPTHLSGRFEDIEW